MQGKAGIPFRIAGAGLWAVILCPLSACQTVLKPVFDEPSQIIAWPAPPQAARIRYVGELRTSDDLKPRRSGLEAIGRLFIGKQAPLPLYGPRAVACTKDGHRVWIADPGGRCLHLFDLERRTYAKVNRVGKTQLLSPVGVCLGRQGSIFVCDSEQVGIYQLNDQDGVLIRALQTPEELQRPTAMYFDERTEELYVADVSAHDVKVLGPGGELHRIIGRRGSGPGEFNFPSAIASGDEDLWIADSGNHRVQAVTRSGEPKAAFGRAGDAPGDLALPKSIALDPAGHVYVVDGRFENIQVFDDQGRLLLFFGEEGAGPGQFWLPGGIFIEPTGRIWICDSYNRRVQVFQYTSEMEHVP